MRNKLQLRGVLLLLSSMLSLTASVRVDVLKDRIFIETPLDQFTQLTGADRARKALLEPGRLAYIHCDKTDTFVVILTPNDSHANFILNLYDLETVNRWIDSRDDHRGTELFKSARSSRAVDPDLAQLLYSVWTKSILTASIGDSSATLGDGSGYSFLVWSKDTGLMGANVSRYTSGTHSGARIEIGLLLKKLILDQDQVEDELSKLRERLASLDRE